MNAVTLFGMNSTDLEHVLGAGAVASAIALGVLLLALLVRDREDGDR